MPRIFDCFTISNELELLEIRLNEMAPVVSTFVIAESSFTFQGDPKPLFYRDNQDRFAAFADRIRHVIVEDMPGGMGEAAHWRRECHQRNTMMSALSDAGPRDLVMLSDVDEIVRAEKLLAVAATSNSWPTVHCFELTFYRYFLNYLYREPWSRSGPRLTERRHLSTMQGLRDVHPPVTNPVRSATRWLKASLAMRSPIRRIAHRDSGWHFSYMGGVERVAQRLRSGSHVIGERSTNPKASMVAEAERRLAAADKDPDLRKVPLDETFPAFLLQNQDRFRDLVAA